MCTLDIEDCSSEGNRVTDCLAVSKGVKGWGLNTTIRGTDVSGKGALVTWPCFSLKWSAASVILSVTAFKTLWESWEWKLCNKSQPHL